MALRDDGRGGAPPRSWRRRQPVRGRSVRPPALLRRAHAGSRAARCRLRLRQREWRQSRRRSLRIHDVATSLNSPCGTTRCNRDGAMFRMASKRVQQRTGAEYFTLGWSCRLQPTSTGLTCGVSHLHVGFNHELGPCHGCPWLVGACERRSKKIMHGGKNLPPRRRVLNWLQARSNYEQLATLTTTTNVFMALNSRWQPASRHAQVGRKEAHTQPEISLAAAVVASLTLAMPRRTTRRWLATARAVAHGHEHRAGFSWR